MITHICPYVTYCVYFTGTIINIPPTFFSFNQQSKQHVGVHNTCTCFSYHFQKSFLLLNLCPPIFFFNIVFLIMTPHDIQYKRYMDGCFLYAFLLYHEHTDTTKSTIILFIVCLTYETKYVFFRTKGSIVVTHDKYISGYLCCK